MSAPRGRPKMTEAEKAIARERRELAETANTAQATAIVERVEGEGQYGPAMAALPEKWRRFALALLQTGCTNSQAYRAAGYSGTDNAVRTNGYKLAHDPRVQAAMQEEAVKLMRDHAPVMIEVLHSIAINPQNDPKSRIKAASELLSRSGLGTMTEHKITVEKAIDREGLVREITGLAQSLGLDPAKLLGSTKRIPDLAGNPAEFPGQSPVEARVIDAEFEEISPPDPHAEARREYQRQWREDHPDYKANWDAKHREKVRQIRIPDELKDIL